MDKNYNQKGNNEENHKELIEKLVNAVKDLNERNVKDFVSGAEEFASLLSKVSSSKFRNFYDEIKSIVESNRDDWKKIYTQLYLIKPKIAYAIGREDRGDVQKSLKSFLELYSSLLEVLNEDNLENFVKLMEAIVAYHKEKTNDKNKRGTEEGGKR